MLNICTEQVLGGLHVFLPYVKDYVNTFNGKSITTWQWKSHLYEYFGKIGDDKVQALDSVNWDVSSFMRINVHLLSSYPQAWFYGEGLELPVKMEYDLTLAEAAYALAERWDASRKTIVSKLDFNESDLKDFDSNQISEHYIIRSIAHDLIALCGSCVFGASAIISFSSLRSCNAPRESLWSFHHLQWGNPFPLL